MLNLEPLLERLHETGTRFVVIRGVAAVAQGSAYVTADLDICYTRDPENLEQLAEALRPLNPRLRGAPEGLPFELDADTLRAGSNFTLVTEEGDLDLLGHVSGLGGYEEARAQS